MVVTAYGQVLARFGQALSDPTRSRVLLALREAPAYPADLAELIGVSRQAMSNHLACLRGCGLVTAVPEGRRTRYELADQRLAHALSDLLGVVLAIDPAVCPSSGEAAADTRLPGKDTAPVNSDNHRAGAGDATGPGRGDHGGGHSHMPGAGADRRYLLIALGLLGAFMLGEVIAAVLSGSLALLSDAGHMLSDVGAIAAALWAIRLAARPASGAWTFGWKRAEILSAAGNGITLLVVSGIVAVEAASRLIHPPRVEGGPVVAVAAAGIAVNVAAGWVLARANRSSLNIQGAFRHVLTDLYGFIGTAAAGVIIVTTGWTQADAIASLIVVALMLKAAWELLRDSGRVLLEAAPKTMDLDDVRTHLLATEHVRSLHDLHAWTVTSSLPALSAHIVIDDSCFTEGNAPRLLDQLQACIAGHFDVEHSTFQFEADTHASHEPGTH